MDRKFILSALLITPLFQVARLSATLGFIDSAIGYTMFYAMPMSLLALVFLPFFRKHYLFQDVNFNFLRRVFLIVFGFALAFSGPLVAPVMLIISFLALIFLWLKEFRMFQSHLFFRKCVRAAKNLPRFYLVYFTLMILINIYSLYIGKFNSENFGSNIIPIGERYSKLAQGFFQILTVNFGFSSLLLLVLINMFIVKRTSKNNERKSILNFAKHLCIFSLCYLLLLPLGGYRPYRPLIIRYDTMIPVTIGLICLYGRSTFYLITTQLAVLKIGRWYLPLLLIFLFNLTIADVPVTNRNACEKKALGEIASSPEKIVKLSVSCPVMDWSSVSDPGATTYKGKLLHYWRITNEDKLFYQ